MALVRVYCGVAAAEMAPWLTVAVVDDSGRLLDMRHISDDPAGYAYLGALLADRASGAAPVAMDRHDHLVAQLLAAANRPLAIADEASLTDFAERFADDTSYEEMQAPLSQRYAVGLARALQAGALYATAQSPSWNLDEFKPVLAAHAAVTVGRQAAAAALREVLRELYPAALRAYPDPAEYVPLKVLEALPEPGLLSASPSSRNREAALVAELSASGVADTTTAVSAITALRVAVEESPRWNTNRALAPVVAETVRQSVAAVRACDSASAALIATLVERLGAITAGAVPTRPYLVHSATATNAAAPVSPAVPRRGPAAEVPLSRLSPRSSTASAAAAGVPAAGPAAVIPISAGAPIPAQRPASDYEPAAYGENRPAFPAGPFGFPEPAHAAEASRAAAGYPSTGYGGQSYQDPAYTPAGYQEPAAYNGSDSRQQSAPRHSEHRQPEYAEPGYPGRGGYPDSPYQESGYQETAYQAGAPATDTGTGTWPAVGDRDAGAGRDTGTWPAVGNRDGSGAWPAVPNQNGRDGTGSWPAVGNQDRTDSWPAADGQDDDIAAVYAGLPAAAARAAEDANAFSADPLTGPIRGAAAAPTSPAPGWPGGQHSTESPVLRLVDSPRDPLTDPIANGSTPPALRLIDGGRHTEPDPAAAEDTDLLIFSQTQSNSAWFILADADAPPTETPTWGRLADEGWRAAEQVSRPAVGAETTAGLPRRVPQANLVPGSAEEPPRQLRIVRDPQSIAAHTSGYFRGWQRGQEIGGYAVGQRDRAAWEFNREQRARENENQRARLS